MPVSHSGEVLSAYLKKHGLLSPPSYASASTAATPFSRPATSHAGAPRRATTRLHHAAAHPGAVSRKDLESLILRKDSRGRTRDLAAPDMAGNNSGHLAVEACNTEFFNVLSGLLTSEPLAGRSPQQLDVHAKNDHGMSIWAMAHAPGVDPVLKRAVVDYALKSNQAPEEYRSRHFLADADHDFVIESVPKQPQGSWMPRELSDVDKDGNNHGHRAAQRGDTEFFATLSEIHRADQAEGKSTFALNLHLRNASGSSIWSLANAPGADPELKFRVIEYARLTDQQPPKGPFHPK